MIARSFQVPLLGGKVFLSRYLAHAPFRMSACSGHGLIAIRHDTKALTQKEASGILPRILAREGKDAFTARKMTYSGVNNNTCYKKCGGARCYTTASPHDGPRPLTNEEVLQRLRERGAPEPVLRYVKDNNFQGDHICLIHSVAELTAGGATLDIALHLLALSVQLRREKKRVAKATPEPKVQITVTSPDGTTVEESFRNQADLELFLNLEGYSGLIDGTQDPSRRVVLRNFADLAPNRVYAAHLGHESYITQHKLARVQMRHKVEHVLEKELTALAKEPVILVGSEVALMEGKNPKGDLDSVFKTESGKDVFLTERKSSLTEAAFKQTQDTRDAYIKTLPPGEKDVRVHSVVFVPAARACVIEFFLNNHVHVLTEAMTFFTAY